MIFLEHSPFSQSILFFLKPDYACVILFFASVRLRTAMCLCLHTYTCARACAAGFWILRVALALNLKLLNFNFEDGISITTSCSRASLPFPSLILFFNFKLTWHLHWIWMYAYCTCVQYPRVHVYERIFGMHVHDTVHLRVRTVCAHRRFFSSVVCVCIREASLASCVRIHVLRMHASIT